MLAALCSFLISWAKSLGVIIINFLIDAVNLAIIAFVSLITTIAGLLPTGSGLPFLPALPESGVYSITIQTLNWLFPIQFIISCTAIITASILAYAVIAPLARWAKLLR